MHQLISSMIPRQYSHYAPADLQIFRSMRERLASPHKPAHETASTRHQTSIHHQASTRHQASLHRFGNQSAFEEAHIATSQFCLSGEVVDLEAAIESLQKKVNSMNQRFGSDELLGSNRGETGANKEQSVGKRTNGLLKHYQRIIKEERQRAKEEKGQKRSFRLKCFQRNLSYLHRI